MHEGSSGLVLSRHEQPQRNMRESERMSIRETTFVSLEGRTVGTLSVERLTSLRPPRYAIRCQQCGTRWDGEGHANLTTNPRCRNLSCGRAELPPAPSMGAVRVHTSAVRSADSDAARRYVADAPRPAPTAVVLPANPDGMRSYLDALERAKQRRTH
jgi:hypothetical protein